MILIDIEQGTESWKQFRKGKIGASYAPIIMNRSPWTTPYQLWKRIIGIDPELEMNSYMQRGLDLEPVARLYASLHLDASFKPIVVEHPEYEWMIASLDGYCFETKKAIEIKCAGSFDHKLALEGKVPDKYYPQLQHQMEVTGLDEIIYLSFDGKEGVFLTVQRNQDYIDMLIEHEKEFYECIQTLSSPSLSDGDYFNMEENEEWKIAAIQWKEIYYQLKELEQKEQEIRENLVRISGQSNAKGMGIQLSKIVRRGNIQYDKIPALFGIDLESYRKEPIISWKIIQK